MILKITPLNSDNQAERRRLLTKVSRFSDGSHLSITGTLKIDLHLHSPASKCFKDSGLTDVAVKIVNGAIDNGLGVIGLTDHHSVDFVPDSQEAAEGTGLTVLPGVELSFVLGDINNVYLLALFKENTPSSELDCLLDNWEIPCSAKGNCHYRMETGIEQVIQDIRRLGGVVISDHADKCAIRKQAIPILIRDYGIRLFDFKYSHTAEEIKKQFPHSIHSFTFSDSHRILEIGSSFSEVSPDWDLFET